MPSLKQKRKLSAEEMKDIFLADRKTGGKPHETDILGGGGSGNSPSFTNK
jgi:hypothetical protein